jgi:hypothetical protein
MRHRRDRPLQINENFLGRQVVLEETLALSAEPQVVVTFSPEVQNHDHNDLNQFRHAVDFIAKLHEFARGKKFATQIFQLVEWHAPHFPRPEQIGLQPLDYLLALLTGFDRALGGRSIESPQQYEETLVEAVRLFSVHNASFEPKIVQKSKMSGWWRRKLGEQAPNLQLEENAAVAAALRFACPDAVQLKAFLLEPFALEAVPAEDAPYLSLFKKALCLRAKFMRGTGTEAERTNFKKSLDILAKFTEKDNPDFRLFAGLRDFPVHKALPRASLIALPVMAKLLLDYLPPEEEEAEEEEEEDPPPPSPWKLLQSYRSRRRLRGILTKSIVHERFEWKIERPTNRWWILGAAILALGYGGSWALFMKYANNLAYSIFTRFALLSFHMWFLSPEEHDPEIFHLLRWMTLRYKSWRLLLAASRFFTALTPTAIAIYLLTESHDSAPDDNTGLFAFTVADALLYIMVALLPSLDFHHREKHFDFPGIFFGLVSAVMALLVFKDPTPTAILAFVTGKFHWSVARAYLHNTLWAAVVVFFMGVFLLSYNFDPCLYLPGDIIPVITTNPDSGSSYECPEFFTETTVAALAGAFLVYLVDIPISLVHRAHIPRDSQVKTDRTIEKLKTKLRDYREQSLRVTSVVLSQVFLLLSAAIPYGLVLGKWTDAESFWEFSGIQLLARYAVLILWCFYGHGFKPSDQLLIMTEWVVSFLVEFWMLGEHIE